MTRGRASRGLGNLPERAYNGGENRAEALKAGGKTCQGLEVK